MFFFCFFKRVFYFLCFSFCFFKRVLQSFRSEGALDLRVAPRLSCFAHLLYGVVVLLFKRLHFVSKSVNAFRRLPQLLVHNRRPVSLHFVFLVERLSLIAKRRVFFLSVLFFFLSVLFFLAISSSFQTSAAAA